LVWPSEFRETERKRETVDDLEVSSRVRDEASGVPALIRRAADGDEQAFRALVKRHEAGVYALALQRLDDTVLAQEVAQDAFVRLFHALKRFRFEASLKTWLYRVTTNLCHDQVRRMRRASRLVSLEPAEEGSASARSAAPDPEQQAITADTGRHVHRALATLAPELREVVQLRYLSGLSYAEIAETLGWPIGTVGTRIHRALRELAQQLRFSSVVEEGS
jgi:RNA polymerase sigma-70 factor (ECF subfamily)